APPAALARPKPYQGVRVRDPVKELLRRKRSLEVQGSKRAPPAVDAAAAPSSQTPFPPAVFSADGGEQWKPAPVTAGLPLGAASWSPADCGQQDGSAAAAYSAAPALAADVYMQTLCPSYAMLTYAPTPLLTNLGVRMEPKHPPQLQGLPVAPAPASLPQVELPDSGLTYLPWAPPLATISTTPNPGLQFAAGATLPGSPLVHVPLSMAPAAASRAEPSAAAPDLQRSPESPLDCELPEPDLDQDADAEGDSDSPSLLDKLLEERKAEEEALKDSYGSSLFIA
ncbi:unnamed protein product, partial [Tetraodon nigroviridis]